MAAWLNDHPQIFMSTPKEIDFFDTDQNLGQVKSLDQYLHIFQDAEDVHLAIGEASVTYLHSQVAVKNVLQFNPAAKFIVMLRNPLDMAPSYYWQLYWSGREGIEDFESAWRARKTRELGSGKVGPLCTELAFLQYENMCKVGAQVERLLQTVNPAAVLFIVIEDLAANPFHEYQRVLEFLGVAYDSKKLFSIQNPAKQVRSNLLHNILTKNLSVNKI